MVLSSGEGHVKSQVRWVCVECDEAMQCNLDPRRKEAKLHRVSSEQMTPPKPEEELRR